MAKDNKGVKGKDEEKKVPLGGIIDRGGTCEDYDTGGWRKLRPILDKEKCTNCLICWVMCPDSAIIVEDGKMVGFNLDHCKGCGICDVECPDKVKAISMVDEVEFEDKD